jgi:putative ABC transport system ATP-binding protein/macrolide transport system ATP-binding/permease protein/lipoprotein-releasing system ATP-binding protein
LLELPRRHNATLIVVTHDLHLAQQADRIVSLLGGKLVSVVAPGPSALAGDRPVARLPAVPSTPLAEIPVAEGLVPGELTPLGSGLGRFLVGFAGWVLLVAALLWGVDYVAARWQQKTIVQKQEVRKRSQELALQKLRADIEDVAYQSDGSYAVTIYLNNPDPEKPFYVLGPTCRVFVQVDQSWQQLPAAAVGFEARGVHEVTGKQLYRIGFRADVRRYEELIKCYLHVRIENVMTVSDSTEPDNDIFQRTDVYYIYLKPQMVSEAEVRQRNGWKDGALVPRWMAMPAH